MHKPSSDLERVYRGACRAMGRDGTSPATSASSQILQKTLRQGEWKITVAGHSRLAGGGNGITAIWPGFHDRAFGLAVDVGSTTIAAHLYRSVDRRGRRPRPAS